MSKNIFIPRLKKLTSIVNTLAALFFLIVGQAQAQTNPAALDLSMSPPVLYLSIKPGETKQHTVLIKNDGTDDVLANLTLSDFRSDSQTGQPVITENTTFSYLKIRDDNLGWKSNFALKSKTEKKIIFDLAVPSNAAEGEFPLTILLNASRIGSNLAGQSQVTGAIGNNLIVLITGSDDDRSHLVVEEITAPKWVDSLQPLKFSLIIKNEGKNAAPISGNITIVNAFGQRVKSYLLYPDMVLAQTTRLARAIDTTQTQITDPQTLLAQPDLLLSTELTYESLFLVGIHTIYFDLPQGKTSQRVIGLPIGLLAALIVVPMLILTAKYVSGLLKRN